MILFYLLLINLIASVLFTADKHKARRRKRRIKESRLHWFEFLGGVFTVLPLMYLIRHKNRKASYYSLTWLALFLWIALLYILCVSDILGEHTICKTGL